MRNLIRSIACCVVLFAICRCTAQDVSASAGASFQNASYGIGFTIGEPVIATHAQAGAVLTQGFHQPDDDFTTVVAEVMNPNAQVIAYPNPARDEVTVQVRGIDGPIVIELFDAAGRTVKERYAFSRSTTLNATSLASGSYHARITTDGTYLTTVQLSITR
ncbi:MAG: T9SS type A sorting domain-containing protein [Flavobacteriales bacterium]|nr:T9SS type A sorting domain-containing protein [Flavobacteriales bacterium]MBP6698919.1 T9SS type A sorting domain-containing protein [Flavobacteriales bacterium]